MAKSLIAKVTINKTAPGERITIDDDDEAASLVMRGHAEYAKPEPDSGGKGGGAKGGGNGAPKSSAPPPDAGKGSDSKGDAGSGVSDGGSTDDGSDGSEVSGT